MVTKGPPEISGSVSEALEDPGVGGGDIFTFHGLVTRISDFSELLTRESDI